MTEAAPAGSRRAGLIGLSVGVLAAGAAAGVAIERLTLGRARRRAREELDAAAPFGSLRGRPSTVAAADGTELYVEVDGPSPAFGREGPRGGGPAGGERHGWFARRPQGPAAAGDRSAVPALLAGRAERAPLQFTPVAAGPEPLTVVFCHGYCLSQDSFHFQRAALRGSLRLVFWDQRSHGRSERSRSYLAGRPASVDELGGDLKAVLDAVAPSGPIVLVGHSMGGMTVMALAEQHPELFRRGRVVGVALLGTSAGDWDSVDLGLPPVGMKLWRRVGPGVVKLLGSQVGWVEATRKFGADVAAVFYRRFSFGNGGRDVDPAVARFAEQLLDATPIDVVAEFYPVFAAHEKAAALAVLAELPVLVMAGAEDLLTPAAHSEAIARALPDAELELLPATGHLLQLERPAEVNRRLAELLCRSGCEVPQYVRDLATGEPTG
ncbi:alpha/beta hydrolase [Streptomyces tateyamensis]|uniref:Alpha/beta hydrolase n=1 Tax=Streptomyces tateyamensis TaxID=565073 RepID=A0A2V4P1G6_9ACTN|nr:alpha/beta hydrolase [Streptomyces tateyamensis]PYC78062.1 alpha/beta hydrolase [Streptomyces tateyamensis]